MKIVHAYPPNIDAIDAVFNVRSRKGVIFTYGDTLFVPDGGHVPPSLIAHEIVHSERQREAGVDSWWRQYFADLQFRLNEELLAHRAEYRKFCEFQRDSNRRIRFLTEIAHRLGGPLYGGLLKPADARRLIAA